MRSIMWLKQWNNISLDCVFKECGEDCTPSVGPNVAAHAGIFEFIFRKMVLQP